MDASPPPSIIPRQTATTTRIAIQGVAGSFHDIAARHFFGEGITLVPALSFEELTRLTVQRKSADAAIMAIENTIAGSILPNYNLLQNNPLHIVGELMLRIRQNLLTLPGVQLDDLTEVRSHPVALAQCQDFFSHYPHIRLVESEDTAASAAWVAEGKNPHMGAIASLHAGAIHGLQLLAANIETYQANYTRFLILNQGEWQVAKGANKVSLSMVLPHSPGSLSRALQLLAEQGADLTKIQSVPLPEHPWEYQFFLDFSHNNLDNLLNSIELLKKEALNLRVLGVYKGGLTYE
jgi:prephenate dehydratase